MNKKTLLFIILVSAITAVFVIYDPSQWLTFDALKNSREQIQAAYQADSLKIASIFLGIYILVAGLAIPGAAILTLAGGAVFGLGIGFMLVSIGSTLGALLSFVLARFFAADFVNKKYPKQLATINKGLERDGAFYLFSLRLIPVFPFFLINLLFGLTSLKAFTFTWVSWVGMLAGTFVYVNAGTQLAQLEGLSGILSPSLLGAFVLLGILPFIGKAILAVIKKRKVYKKWNKPKKFDYNLVAIGAGAGGLVASNVAASIKAKVALIEKEKMGGDCLNTGCVPSKALLKIASLVHAAEKVSQFSPDENKPKIDFSKVKDYVNKAIEGVAPHDSVERYEGLGVEVIKDTATIISPWQVQVGERVLTTRNIVIATGASPFVPPIPGLDKVDYLTSDSVWNLEDLPKKLLILGGGAIGLEMAQAFSRLGSKVSLVEGAPQLLPAADEKTSSLIKSVLEDENVDVYINSMAEAVSESGNALIIKQGDTKQEIAFDKILIAVGRKPITQGFGLENLDIEIGPRGEIPTDDTLRTIYPNIFAAGDVTGRMQLTHVAGNHGWYAAVNALLAGLKSFKVSEAIIPHVVYTSPEIAGVGLTETQAKQQEIAHEVTTFDLAELDRAIADGETKGFLTVITAAGTDKILGATIVAPRAGEMILEYVIAMKSGLGLNKLLAPVRAYPSYAEAGKYLAGDWKKQRVPAYALKWAKKWNGWNL